MGLVFRMLAILGFMATITRHAFFNVPTIDSIYDITLFIFLYLIWSMPENK